MRECLGVTQCKDDHSFSSPGVSEIPTMCLHPPREASRGVHAKDACLSVPLGCMRGRHRPGAGAGAGAGAAAAAAGSGGERLRTIQRDLRHS